MVVPIKKQGRYWRWEETAVTLPLRIQRRGPVGLQIQVFEQVRAMILEGRLRSGEPLPATRVLSEQLAISRNTITLAYERLMAEGYIESHRSRGTFVSSQIPETTLYTAAHGEARFPARRTRNPSGVGARALRAPMLVNPNRRRLTADFWVGRPDPSSFPARTWATLIARRLRTAGSALTEYRDPAGLIDLRKAICNRLRPARSIVADADQIVIVGGSQDGLNLAARLVIDAGTSAVIESPCYQGAAFLFESFGAKLFAVRVDGKGLDCRRLPDVRDAICYVTPSHQYPLGVTLSLERRLELLAWAARTNSYIVEDDYDSDFRFQGAPIAALKGLDRADRVIYLGTFSKCLGAGLRLGYVVLPEDLVQRARQLKTLMNNGQPWLEQAALADFMASGGYDRHIRRIRNLYLARRNALVSALRKHFDESEIIGDEAGMHLAWRLPQGLPNAHEVERIGLEAGVGVYTLASGAAISLDRLPDSERYLVLGFSSLTEREIESGIAVLAAALKTWT